MRAGGKLTIFVLLLGLLLLGSVAVAQEGGDSERGAELYQTYCVMCHGLDGRGRVGANLQSFPGIAVDAALQQTITRGVAGSVMPAFSETQGGPLSDVDIADVSAYISSVLRGTEPIAPAPTYQPPEIPPLPDIEGNPSNGAVVFQNNCVACHGKQAQGGFGWPLAKNWPGNQPEVFISQIVATGIEGSKMPSWAQENGGPLTQEEIEDVTAYILTLDPGSGLPEFAAESPGPLGTTISWTLLAAFGLVLAIVLVRYYRKA
ncbi:MAG: c-type cytochrome [Anaerolineales bacterium]|nr:MAG: c-type cytochrome [Anaerolineales bacterium]